MLVLLCVPCWRIDLKHLVCRVRWAALEKGSSVGKQSRFHVRKPAVKFSLACSVWVQAHAKDVAALLKQLGGLFPNLPSFPAQWEQAKADWQAHQAQAATVEVLQGKWQGARLEIEVLRQKMRSVRDEDCRWREWQLQLMRWRQAKEQLRVQLQSAKQGLEALKQPAEAAEQLQRVLEAAHAQRCKMQVGHTGGDMTR